MRSGGADVRVVPVPLATVGKGREELVTGGCEYSGSPS
jgi:hypothetical protein